MLVAEQTTPATQTMACASILELATTDANAPQASRPVTVE
jgi:hypothetical protein